MATHFRGIKSLKTWRNPLFVRIKKWFHWINKLKCSELLHVSYFNSLPILSFFLNRFQSFIIKFLKITQYILILFYGRLFLRSLIYYHFYRNHVICCTGVKQIHIAPEYSAWQLLCSYTKVRILIPTGTFHVMTSTDHLIIHYSISNLWL